jgi:DNA-directed RNA polymerase specialized sigma24 family protein
MGSVVNNMNMNSMISTLTSAFKFWRPRTELPSKPALNVESKPGENNREEEFSRFTTLLKREISEADWKLFGKLVQGCTYEDLTAILDIPVEQIKAEEARLRWALRNFVKRHRFDQNGNSLIHGFLKRAFSLLSQ